jgi:hypothetical protein
MGIAEQPTGRWTAVLSYPGKKPDHRPRPLVLRHSFEYRLGAQPREGINAMNHDTHHFDENEETLNCGVSDEELEAAARFTNLLALSTSVTKTCS